MAAKRRKLVKEDFEIGYGATTIPTDSGGTRAATKIGLHTFMDVISVKDLGAVGDGVTDDTTAIQLAVTTAIAQSKGLFFPPGYYVVTDTAITVRYANTGFQCYGVPLRSVLVNKAGASKPTILLKGAQYFHIEGLVLSGRAGFTNDAIKTTHDADETQRCAYGYIGNVYAQANGVGIHLTQTNTVTIKNFSSWPSGGGIFSSTADSNGNTNGILADGTEAVNGIIIDGANISNTPTIANGGSSIKWNTTDNSQVVVVMNSNLELTNRTTYRSIDFTNVYNTHLVNNFAENTSYRFLKCQYGEITNDDGAGSVLDITFGDGTAGNACLYFNLNTLTANSLTADANCQHINTKNCVWQTLSNSSIYRTRISDVAGLDQPDEIGYAGFRERGRTVNVGEWTTPTYDAANFTASGSLTWTVGSGDVTTYAYTLIGKTMTVMFSLEGTSTGGTASTLLKIAIPGGFTAAKTTYANMFYLDAGGAKTQGNATISASATTINLGKLNAGTWSNAAANNTDIYGQITFEVA